jgi:hypothetical protein
MSRTLRTSTFVYTQPRDLEGTPYEVASAAAEQTAKVLDVAAQALSDLFVVARVAEMERQDEPDSQAFQDGPQGVKLQGLRETLTKAASQTRIIGAAAGYDPKHPPVA